MISTSLYRFFMLKKIVIAISIILLQGCTTHQKFEVVAQLENAPVNVAVSADNRVFLSFQQGAIKVGELKANGQISAISVPDETSGIFGIKMGSNNLLWMIDAGINNTVAKLYAWDIEKEKLITTIKLIPKEDKTPRFFQDFALDEKNQMAYIADTGFSWTEPIAQPALWRVNLNTGELTLLLKNDPSFTAEKRHITFHNQPLAALGPDGLIPSQFGINPIAIDAAHEWVYFGAMEGTQLSRLSTADLINDALSSDQLSEKIEFVAKKPYSDGIIIDDNNAIYVTDLEKSGIGVIDNGGEYQLLFSDESIIQWPDGLSCAPDNWIYATTNQYHLNAAFNKGIQEAKAPYYLIKFKAKGKCSIPE